MQRAVKLLKKNVKFLRFYNSENSTKQPNDTLNTPENKSNPENESNQMKIPQTTKETSSESKETPIINKKSEEELEDEIKWTPFKNEKEIPWKKDIPPSELDPNAGDYSEDSRSTIHKVSDALRYVVITLLCLVFFGYFYNLYQESKGIYDPDREYIIKAQKGRLEKTINNKEEDEKLTNDQDRFKDEIAKILAEKELEKEKSLKK